MLKQFAANDVKPVGSLVGLLKIGYPSTCLVDVQDAAHEVAFNGQGSVLHGNIIFPSKSHATGLPHAVSVEWMRPGYIDVLWQPKVGRQVLF